MVSFTECDFDAKLGGKQFCSSTEFKEALDEYQKESFVLFHAHLAILRRTDPTFVFYLSSHWLYILRKWAVHAQPKLVHFGNTTNNRLENADGLVKEFTHHADTVEHAIQKVTQHTGWLIRQCEMKACFSCDRRERFTKNTYVGNELSRMTTYAASLVNGHLTRFP